MTAFALAADGGGMSHIDYAWPSLDEDKVNYVVGHSDGMQLGGYDAAALANLLSARGMKSGMAVRLVGCFTGSDDVHNSIFGLARSLALILRDEKGLTDIAVKGALGQLIKTKRSEGPEAGTSGVYTGVKHNYQNTLAKHQNDLMKSLATALAAQVQRGNVEEFARVRGSVEAILSECSAPISVVSATRAEIAKAVATSLPTAFKRNASLHESEPRFLNVMAAVKSIADAVRGQFESDVAAATRVYANACKETVGKWLSNVSQQPDVKKVEPGNITYVVGSPKWFPTSQKYADKLVGGDLIYPQQ